MTLTNSMQYIGQQTTANSAQPPVGFYVDFLAHGPLEI